MKFLPVGLQVPNLLLFWAQKSLILDNFFLCSSIVLLGDAVLLGKQSVFLVYVLVCLLEPKFLIVMRIISCTGKSIHSCFKILNLRFQNLIFSGEFIDLLCILCCLLQCNNVFFDCAQIFNPLFCLIELPLNFPKFAFSLLQLIPQLFVFNNEFFNQLMLILKLFHVDRT